MKSSENFSCWRLDFSIDRRPDRIFISRSMRRSSLDLNRPMGTFGASTNDQTSMTNYLPFQPQHQQRFDDDPADNHRRSANPVALMRPEQHGGDGDNQQEPAWPAEQVDQVHQPLAATLAIVPLRIRLDIIELDWLHHVTQ